MTIEIYGTEWCSFCKQAVLLCESKSIDFKYIDVDDTVNFRSLEERLGTKPRSVPQIFKDGLLVPGGFTGLQEALAKN